MINPFNWFHKWQARRGYPWLLLVLLAAGACQPAPSISTSTPKLSPTQIPTTQPASTESVVTSLPTVVNLPTATQSIATEATSTLSPSGPWLAYLRDGLTIVNQNGTGHTVQEYECNVGIEENALNRLVVFPGIVYLVQPGPTWRLIYREWPTCHTDFTGNEKGGLLASIDYSPSDALPQLRIYALPSGKIREQFPLMKCSEPCNTDNVGWWEIRWSPNGRYLAFPAVWNGQSSDLYVYDTENGAIRRLTTGPDDVGTIWWSPDSSQILMGEIHENSYPYTSSLWDVSLSSGEVRLLYSLDENRYPKGLLGWLDNKRFIGYYGITLADALELPADHLAVVDISSGEVTALFNGSFMTAILDEPHETVMFFTNDEAAGEGFEGPGIYLVSATKPGLHHLEEVHFTTWDAALALFVTDAPCENDAAGRKAFNYRGEWQCVHPGIQPESLSSPDGTWQVSLENGFWLKTKDQQTIQVSQETPTQIIWRRDSGGIFFIAHQILYYTSLPELDIKIVDQYPGGDSIVYQWVGGD